MQLIKIIPIVEIRGVYYSNTTWPHHPRQRAVPLRVGGAQ